MFLSENNIVIDTVSWHNNCIFQRRLKELFLLPVKTVISRILSHSEVISSYKHFRMVNYMSRSIYKHDIS